MSDLLAPPSIALRRRSTMETLALDPARELGAGGEARVLAVPGDDSLVAKLYHQPTLAKARKVALMMEEPPELDASAARLAWPCDLLFDGSGAFAGFLMPRAEGPRVFELYNPVTRRRTAPMADYAFLLRAAANVAAAFEALHARGYVVGDVNESNLLVGDDASVTLVDTDSMQVRDPADGAVHRSRVGKAEFTPPELQGRSFADFDRSPEHDRFGLAVLLFLLLMEGTHPFAGRLDDGGEMPPIEERIRRGLFPHDDHAEIRPPRLAPDFSLLAPGLRVLFIRCFEDGHAGPAARPTAAEWRAALAEAEAKLVTCDVNPRHRHGRHLGACPWCLRAVVLKGRDPFPADAKPAPGRPARIPAPRVAPPAPAPTARAASQPPAPTPTTAAASQPPAPASTAGAASQPIASTTTAGAASQPIVSASAAGAASQPMAPASTAGAASQPIAPASTAGAASQPIAPASTAGAASQPPAPASTAGAASQPIVPASAAGAASRPIAPASTAGAASQPIAPASTAGAASQPTAPGSMAGAASQPPAPVSTAGAASQPIAPPPTSSATPRPIVPVMPPAPTSSVPPSVSLPPAPRPKRKPPARSAFAAPTSAVPPAAPVPAAAPQPASAPAASPATPATYHLPGGADWLRQAMGPMGALHPGAWLAPSLAVLFGPAMLMLGGVVAFPLLLFLAWSRGLTEPKEDRLLGTFAVPASVLLVLSIWMFSAVGDSWLFPPPADDGPRYETVIPAGTAHVQLGEPRAILPGSDPPILQNHQQILFRLRERYPDSRGRGAQSLRLIVHVRVDGTVDPGSIQTDSTDPLLSDAVEEVAREMVFVPPVTGGRVTPGGVWMDVRYGA